MEMIFIGILYVILVIFTIFTNSIRADYASPTYKRRLCPAIIKNRFLILGFMVILYLWWQVAINTIFPAGNHSGLPDFWFLFNGFLFPLMCLGSIIFLLSNNSEFLCDCRKMSVKPPISAIILLAFAWFVFSWFKDFFVFIFSSPEGRR